MNHFNQFKVISKKNMFLGEENIQRQWHEGLCGLVNGESSARVAVKVTLGPPGLTLRPPGAATGLNCSD
jgi:hypothetical protein